MKKIRIFVSLFVVLAIFISLNLVINAKEESFENHKLGAKIEKKIMKEQVTKILKFKTSLPSVVSHIGDMPPVGNQGSQGSCVGWASSYYKAYQEKKDMSWGNKMFSPAFIYNQIHLPNDGGAYMSDAYELMTNLGNCRLTTMPYNMNDYETQPNNTQLKEASNFKAIGWNFFVDVGFNAAKSESLKQYLQNDCLTVTVPVYADFGTGFYDNDDGPNYGGHAICIIGYSDSKGAFKFINSWGAEYGYNGYGYITYNLWDKFVTNDLSRSYIMVDGDSDPLTTYKNKITFKDARIVDKGPHGAGNQWAFAIKNESKSTIIKYYKKNTSNPIVTKDSSLISSYDGCYIGIREYDNPSSNDDRVQKIYKSLDYGDNTIYITVKDKEMGVSNYWSKWRFIINRKKVAVN